LKRSFCNEQGCSGSAEAGSVAFREATYRADGTRPTLANMNSDFGGVLSRTIDVQGFSHSTRSVVDSYHKSYPTKPLYMSECCSCTSDRDSGFPAACAQSQTNISDAIPYIAGTMVWTLFDYYGEPSGDWPAVSSSFGQIDLAGFPKDIMYWYRYVTQLCFVLIGSQRVVAV
jgi:hypothetical protein